MSRVHLGGLRKELDFEMPKYFSCELFTPNQSLNYTILYYWNNKEVSFYKNSRVITRYLFCFGNWSVSDVRWTPSVTCLNYHLRFILHGLHGTSVFRLIPLFPSSWSLSARLTTPPLSIHSRPLSRPGSIHVCTPDTPFRPNRANSLSFPRESIYQMSSGVRWVGRLLGSSHGGSSDINHLRGRHGPW